MSLNYAGRTDSLMVDMHDEIATVIERAAADMLNRFKDRLEREAGGTRLLENVAVDARDTPENAADRLLDAVFAKYRLVPREKS